MAGHEELKILKEELCMKRIEVSKQNKSKPWTIDDLIEILSSLKNGKSRDPHGLVNEIFKPGVSGIDFQRSFLEMGNKIRDQIYIPEFMEYSDIVSIYKGKGEKMDLSNDRGIFIVNIFRSIITKLVYRDKYKLVDKNMSDSNVGARKDKNIRNHIFVLNGVINEVLNNKDLAVDVQILDYKQCFDSMWLEETINDLWEAGITDDNLALIYKFNEKVKVAVKSPFGITERKVVNRIVMQGETFGPLCCSVQVDGFGKECIQKKKLLYYYKNQVGVPPLAMVDDLVCISLCGVNSVKMNAYVNAKTNLKKLQFGATKCHKMHVGAKRIFCPDLKVDNWEVSAVENIQTGETEITDEYLGTQRMETSDSEKYLGDLISSDGTNTKNIQARRAKGIGIVDQIMDILTGTIFGPFYFEVGLILRESLLVNSILTNSEAWYGLKDTEVEQLEQSDESFLRKFLEVGKCCPKEMLYLETGSLPLRFIIMTRRLMYFHYLLNENEDSLVHKFLKTQIESPSKNDWILLIEKDLSSLEIYLSYENIKGLSKLEFKSFVQECVRRKALHYLNAIKSSHRKVMHIKHSSLNLQTYFLPQNIRSVQLSKFILQSRTRMLEFRANFRQKFLQAGYKCELGCDAEDNQEHLLFCSGISDSSISTGSSLQYSDLFSDQVDSQIKIASVMNERMKKRKVLMK